jgi:predicted membrane protein
MNAELLGTLASVIVLLSFIVTEEKRIRMINIVGAAVFVVYGLLIQAFSVWFLNAVLILIHSWYLLKGKVVMQCGKRKEPPPGRKQERSKTARTCRRHCIRQGTTRKESDA